MKMTTRMTPRTGAEGPQESVDALEKASGTTGIGIGEKNTVDACLCGVCLERMRPGGYGSPKRFCSADCRRLAWAIRALAEALAAGHAEGLRKRICGLVERVGAGRGQEEAKP